MNKKDLSFFTDSPKKMNMMLLNQNLSDVFYKKNVSKFLEYLKVNINRGDSLHKRIIYFCNNSQT